MSWEEGGVHFQTDSLVFFTDGSLLVERESSGQASVYNAAIYRKVALGRYTTIFQAYIYAILLAFSSKDDLIEERLQFTYAQIDGQFLKQ